MCGAILRSKILDLRKILISPDSYKDCLSSDRVSDAMEKGVHRADVSIKTIKIPASDGGEGFCACMKNIYGGSYVRLAVTYPDRSEGIAEYVISIDGESAFIELASASGLMLVPQDRRDPLYTTSLGTGEIIKDAVLKGAKKIFVGLGGSATNDCGMGILSALGYRFYDKSENELFPCGSSLIDVAKIDNSRALNLDSVEIIAACDVKNPLCGKNGAAYVFAPQKGADTGSVDLLEKGALNFASACGINKDLPGSGAAGGCGAALLSLLGAKFVSGAELLTGSEKFLSALRECDLVITGEGKTDLQTLNGKLVYAVSSAAKRYGKPVAVVSGAVSDLKSLSGLADVILRVSPEVIELEQAIADAENNIIIAVEKLIKELMNTH